MTRFDPSLFVKRVVIRRNDYTAYDERFHVGVNVIRGENSSGKSTVLNFIYYGLGGDLTDWSEVALLCTSVWVEVQLSGVVATLRREVNAQTGAPMEVFGGSYDASLAAPRDAWKKYPYRRSTNTESFSQVIFRLIGMPEVLNDLSGNITVHQILRLLYADQLSPVDDLFRFERFEQSSLRDTIGRLLCGAYASQLYNNEQQIRALSKEFDGVEAELKSLFAILGSHNVVPTYEWVTATRAHLNNELKQLLNEIEKSEQEIFTSAESDKLSLAEQNKVYEQVQGLQARIVEARKSYDKTSLDIVDSNSFISALKNKITALRDAATTAEHFGNVQFHTCPACYSVVEDQDEDKQHACHLCKAPFDPDALKGRIAGLINENAIQLKQSQVLQKRRYDRLASLQMGIDELSTLWSQASDRLRSLQKLPSTELRQRLRELHRQSGYIERQIEDLENQSRIVTKISELSNKKAALNAEISRLKAENEGFVLSQKNQLSRAYTLIADEIKKLLIGDLRRQDTFEDPKSVNFTFSENKIIVDGQSYFSASSRAILKSSFCLGFMAAAAKSPTFRHPRFVMIDVLENMGVETVRSQNFQVQIAKLSSELRAEHQIIYATAMIAPDLDNDTFTVGRYSTRDKPTLAIVR